MTKGNSQGSAFGFQNGLFKPVLESQSFVGRNWAFWEQKMLRIKKQSHKGRGQKEYPETVIQKPILPREEWGIRRGEGRGLRGLQRCADLVGRSGPSRRGFPRSLHRHRPLPTRRLTWEWEPALTHPQYHLVLGGTPLLGLTFRRSARWPDWLLSEQGLPKCL